MTMTHRNYKDNVFCLLYRDKANLLELYNGLNGTYYRDPEGLTVVTLPNTICIRYRNDAAFTFSKDLYLCEQQSTENPNMPLRFLHYVSEEYRRIVTERNLYRQNAVSIPAPHFVVFYNGTTPLPERQTYRLSDLYEGREGEPDLEIRALVLNINSGNNPELMERCRTLSGYMTFVDKVRGSQQALGTEAAVRQAVEECIAEGVLREFFQEHKEEVVGMSIWEFNEELYREAMREDALEDGHKKGLQEGREEGLQQGLVQGLEQGLEQGLQQGLQQGILQKRVELVCRKLRRGKGAEQIAEELEERAEDLQPILAAAKKHAPGYDPDAVLRELGL